MVIWTVPLVMVELSTSVTEKVAPAMLTAKPPSVKSGAAPVAGASTGASLTAVTTTSRVEVLDTLLTAPPSLAWKVTVRLAVDGLLEVVEYLTACRAAAIWAGLAPLPVRVRVGLVNEPVTGLPPMGVKLSVSPVSRPPVIWAVALAMVALSTSVRVSAGADRDRGAVLGVGGGAGSGVERRGVVDRDYGDGTGDDVGQVVHAAAVVDLEAGDAADRAGVVGGVLERDGLEGGFHLGEGGPVARQRHGGAGEVAGDGVAADGREAQHVGAALEPGGDLHGAAGGSGGVDVGEGQAGAGDRHRGGVLGVVRSGPGGGGEHRGVVDRGDGDVAGGGVGHVVDGAAVVGLEGHGAVGGGRVVGGRRIPDRL